MSIEITDEMREYARTEGHRRETYIRHHFGVYHLTPEETDQIGFLGEFACCELLGINWKNNIRENYYSIDSGDITFRDPVSGNTIVVDVKTETIPQPYFNDVINRRIDDDGVYGRRLINQGQLNLLNHYNYVIFGGFVRDNYNRWYPFGYMETNAIIGRYEATSEAPFGGRYPSPAAPIKTSELGRIRRLMAYLNAYQNIQNQRGDNNE